MANTIELAIAKREVVGKAAKRLRKDGLIPGNIYGHKEESVAVQFDAVTFDNLRRKHGLRHILSLKMPGAGTQTALVRHVQRAPKSGEIVHVDFYRVAMNERLAVSIPLHFVGESAAVKDQNGTLLHMDALQVECAASDLVDALEIDISSLDSFDAAMHASDVKLPANYTLVTSPEEVVAKVTTPRLEEAATEETSATEESNASASNEANKAE